MDIKILRIISTIPTHIIKNGENFPTEFGSGCFVKYCERYKLFLTVYHTVNDTDCTKNIVVDFVEEKGAKLSPLPDQSGHVEKYTLGNPEGEDLDFAFYNIQSDFPECYLLCGNENGELLGRIPRHILSTNLLCEPQITQEYGFSGLTYGSKIISPFVDAKFKDICKQELVEYSGLKYKKSEGDYHYFTMPNNDYEYDDFKGTSGAPILDNDGNLIALVVEGGPSSDKKEWIIKGLNLLKYKVCIDGALGLIK